MDVRFDTPEKIKTHFSQLDSSFRCTSGYFEIPSMCQITDLDWNQMDQEHRPWIHNTYKESARLIVQKDAQLSVNVMRLFGIPLMTSVADFRIESGHYYQGFSVFSLAYVHTVTRCEKDRHVGEWHIISHWVFKPLHWYINWKMQKMNRVQNNEDVPVRQRRQVLRNLGFRFKFDDQQDFLNSNTKTNNVIYPSLRNPGAVDLSKQKVGARENYTLENMDWIVIRDSESKFRVWHGVCPHEGGPMREGKICGDGIQCPWHGLVFQGIELEAGGPSKKAVGYQLEIDSTLLLKVGP